MDSAGVIGESRKPFDFFNQKSPVKGAAHSLSWAGKSPWRLPPSAVPSGKQHPTYRSRSNAFGSRKVPFTVASHQT